MQTLQRVNNNKGAPADPSATTALSSNNNNNNHHLIPASDKRDPLPWRNRCLLITFIVFLCCFFFELGAYKMGGARGDLIHKAVSQLAGGCGSSAHITLEFDTHQRGGVVIVRSSEADGRAFPPCRPRLADLTPCHDQARAMTFPRDNMVYRERHCAPDKLRCLVPAPRGYLSPFTWPKSRDYVPYVNVPHKSLTVEKAVQNWVQFDGDVFVFPGGGTMFPQGADAYIDEIASVVPIGDGTVRTALDTGCGVASWGAYLLERNVLTMSFAPRDSHEAQVQFALERGVPAVIGVLGTIRLPYPSRSFDMAHCSRCLIPWTSNDGMYLMEVDRVLRPGGYWILSGPPINWKTYYKTWKQSEESLEREQKKIEDIAQLLCWEKKYEKGDIAIWRKSINDASCTRKEERSSMETCNPSKVDDIWYKKMTACISPYPRVSKSGEMAGGRLKKFPKRLFAVPPAVARGYVPGISVKVYEEDNILWKKYVSTYQKLNKLIGTTRYRNIMDMNAALGGFASALESPKAWVMNVVPTISEKDTLGIIYERGLIGIYHDWCEAFSTYPRTYDLIHASSVFTLYQNKCEMEDILFEMDRILRPEGAVIFRDDADTLIKVKNLVSRMRWDTKLSDNEDGPLAKQKILMAVKRYWVASASNSTSP